MTILTLIFVIAATASLSMAFVALRFSQAPRWHHERWLAGAAAIGSLYTAIDASQTLKAPASIFVAGACVQLLCVSVVLACWARYIGPMLGRERTSVDSGLLVLLVAVGFVGLVPGVSYSTSVSTHHAWWSPHELMIIDPTWVGILTFVVYMFFLLRLLLQAVSAARRGFPLATRHAAALVALSTAGANDILNALGWITTPLLVGLGFLVPIAVAFQAITSRFFSDAEALDALSARLEKAVEERTSELARAQENLRREETLAAMGRLAAGVAHEINNPAAAVSANLEYLRETLVDEKQIPQDVEEALDDSRSAIRRIAAIVTQLLEAGRVAASSPIESVDLGLVVARVVRAVDALRPTSIRIETTLPAGVRVRGSSDLVEQLLLNLVSNAVQAIPPGRAGLVQVRAVTRAGRVFIEVEDDGSGIPENVVPRIFEPFFTTKPPGKGTGLGLAVSRGLIRAMEGVLSLGATGPEGTRMVVELPSGEGHGVAPAVPALERIPPRRGRVLLVDDEPALLRAVRRVLATRYDVLTAEGVDAGLTLVRDSGPFDAIVCDVIMPLGGGRRFVEELRRMAPEQALRCVFQTGGEHHMVATLGVPIIEKPASPQDLIAAVERVRRPSG